MSDAMDYTLERGLIFRSESAKYGGGGWFRITIGSAEENKMAVQVVKDYLSSMILSANSREFSLILKIV